MKYEIHRDKNEEIVIGSSPCLLTPAHMHNILEIMYVEKGHLTARIGDMCYEASDGQFVAVSSFVAHDYKTDVAGHNRLLMIPRGKFLPKDSRFDTMCFASPVAADENGDMKKLFDVIEHLYPRNTHDRESIRIIESLSAAAVELAVLRCGLKPKSRSSELMTRAIEYINRHYLEPISVTELTEALGCYQQTLAHLFSATFGLSITEYINHLRALDAARIIEESPHTTLQELSDMTGFGSVRSLLRAYRKEFGETPKKRGTAITGNK